MTIRRAFVLCIAIACAATASQCGGDSARRPQTGPHVYRHARVPERAPVEVYPHLAGGSAGPHLDAGVPHEGLRAWSTYPGGILELDHVTQIAARGRYTCALRSDGVVWCWNAMGILGPNGQVNAEVMSPNFVVIPNLPDVEEIAVGANHACALLHSRTVRCWGANDTGALGDGTTTARETPVEVVGLRNVSQLALGFDHSCARLTDDTVRCWGRNLEGELGDRTRDRRLTPVAVPGLAGVADITAGQWFTCARLHDQTARCWGDNRRDTLGCSRLAGEGCSDPTHTEVAPVAVHDLRGVLRLAAGDAHVCARLANGSVSCWGDRQNNAQQLGYSRQGWPSEWKTLQISAGPMSACAITEDGRTRCWGDFAFEAVQRGDESHPVVALPGLRDISQITLSAQNTCVRYGDGVAQCWVR